jgi:putative NADPH-quinone reductase
MQWASIHASGPNFSLTEYSRTASIFRPSSASDNGTLPKEVVEELERMDRADLLVFQYPLWWHLPPAISKGWFDRIWVYGAAYTSTKRFENGRFCWKTSDAVGDCRHKPRDLNVRWTQR